MTPIKRPWVSLLLWLFLVVLGVLIWDVSSGLWLWRLEIAPRLSALVVAVVGIAVAAVIGSRLFRK